MFHIYSSTKISANKKLLTKVLREELRFQTSDAVNAYIEELERKLVSATKDALSKLVPISIGAGKGECKMNISRRATDGKRETILGVNPYAPCDHEVGVICVKEKSGGQLALMIDWPSHAVVPGPKNYLITGDWPGAASKFVEESGGKQIAPVFIGASGDINPIYGPHIDFEDNNSYAFGKDAIGEDLGREVLRVAKDIQTYSSAKIAALQRLISLPAVQGDSVRIRLRIATAAMDTLLLRTLIPKPALSDLQINTTLKEDTSPLRQK
jgi:hypothetical protein